MEAKHGVGAAGGTRGKRQWEGQEDLAACVRLLCNLSDVGQAPPTTRAGGGPARRGCLPVAQRVGGSCVDAPQGRGSSKVRTVAK